jgi:phenylalanyl-tRNA synthetase beta chain
MTYGCSSKTICAFCANSGLSDRMKLSYEWLKEWVDVPWDAAELGARLTMAGFELEGIEACAHDSILALKVMPNRGDAMSVLGVAREVAALAGKVMKGPAIAPVSVEITDTFPVHVEAPVACPTFVGRVIRGVNNRVTTPAWMQARLQAAELRSVSPIVDVTNYVLLELGQPMHAYDFATLRGEIRVRHARAAERLQLLDSRTVALEPDMLVIADREAAVGLAGIMGGARTAVAAETRDVFLESAYFSDDAIRGRARRLGLQTDASQHFERGVDPTLQRRAIERASALLIEIAGGRAGPITALESAAHQPLRPEVLVRRTQLARLLGATIGPQEVEGALSALQMHVRSVATGWQVTPPAHRFDITIESDLIEEVARMVGYAAIPEREGTASHHFRALSGAQPAEAAVLEVMAARGYHEAINYSFVDPQLQLRLFPERASVALANPIASDLSVMRVSLWPGLLRTVAENQRRQQERIRLLEHGVCFRVETSTTLEVDMLAAVACGPRLPEQWGLPRDMRVAVDFFDLKADLEALLAATGAEGDFAFEPAELSCLHPGRAARVLRQGGPVGWLGELHPVLVRELDFTYTPVLFELDFYDALRLERAPFSDVSRFPLVRRDLAIVVDENVSLSALRERVVLSSSSLLAQCRVFDVYRGPGLETGTKSIALGLIFQDLSRTLTDEDVDSNVASIIVGLRASLNAKIRE